MTSTVIEGHKCHFYVYFNLNLLSYGPIALYIYDPLYLLIIIYFHQLFIYIYLLFHFKSSFLSSILNLNLFIYTHIFFCIYIFISNHLSIHYSNLFIQPYAYLALLYLKIHFKSFFLFSILNRKSFYFGSMRFLKFHILFWF